MLTRLPLQFLFLVLALLWVQAAYAQQPTTITADQELRQVQIRGEAVKVFVGNVQVDQPDKTIYCDSAYQFNNSGNLKLKGNVRILQKEDGSLITGDTLFINKASRRATMIGQQVRLTEGTRTLTTTELDYNIDTRNIEYSKGAEILDGTSRLVSKRGQYNRGTGVLYFREQVVVDGENGQLTTDTLDYNTKTKTALFRGPSRITSPDGVINSTRGSYNTETGATQFDQRAAIETPEYILTGDVVQYSRAQKWGYGKGNVQLYSKKDTIYINGDEARYDNAQGFAHVYGNSLLRKPTGPADTLYVRADTMMSVTLPDSSRLLKAYYHVKIFKADLQGKCDSLRYGLSDSLLTLYRDPILWSGKNQLTADTIRLVLKGSRPDTMFLRQNAFMVSIDTLGNYNQLKGRNMKVGFDSGSVSRLYVDGNGHSLFFALEGDTALLGMNKVVCSNMIAYFNRSKLRKINFINQPEAEFVPPNDLLEPEKRLKGFIWRGKERITLADVRPLAAAKTAPAPPAKKRSTPVKKQKKKPVQLKKR